MTGTERAETDLLGRDLDGSEEEILEVYRRLRRVAGRADLPPCAEANLRHALAYAWNAANDLGLAYEHLTDD